MRLKYKKQKRHVLISPPEVRAQYEMNRQLKEVKKGIRGAPTGQSCLFCQEKKGTFYKVL